MAQRHYIWPSLWSTPRATFKTVLRGHFFASTYPEDSSTYSALEAVPLFPTVTADSPNNTPRTRTQI